MRSGMDLGAPSWGGGGGGGARLSIHNVNGKSCINIFIKYLL